MNTRTLLATGCLLSATIITAVNPARKYHDSLGTIQDTTIVFAGDFTDTEAVSGAIEVRASLPRASEQSPLEAFSVIWDVASDGDEYYRATIRPIDPMPDDVFDRRAILFTVDRHTAKGDSTITESRHRTDFGLERNENALGVEVDYRNNRAIVYGGDGVPKELVVIEMGACVSPVMGIQAEGKAKIIYVVTESVPDPAVQLSTHHTPESLGAYFITTHAPEGIYQYLDSQWDRNYTRSGGNYTLALVKTEDGFDIIYLDGAKTNKSRWKPGMLKGQLHSTIFTNHYNLTWYDSSGNPLTEECSADIEQNAILTLNFPLLKTSMRFSLVPN